MPQFRYQNFNRLSANKAKFCGYWRCTVLKQQMSVYLVVVQFEIVINFFTLNLLSRAKRGICLEPGQFCESR